MKTYQLPDDFAEVYGDILHSAEDDVSQYGGDPNKDSDIIRAREIHEIIKTQTP